MIDPVKADDRKEERGEQRAMQAGARLYPVPRSPKQDLPKLGEKGRPPRHFSTPPITSVLGSLPARSR
jgi:hypothetical protein